MRRCPACSARVGMDVLECPICGHEFGTTEPSEPVSPSPATGRRGVEQSTGDQDATFEAPASPKSRGIAAAAASVLRSLPWGVIGVVAMIAAIVGGSAYMLRDASLLGPLRFNATQLPIVGTAASTAVRAATSTPPPPTFTPVPVPQTRTPMPPLDYLVKPNDTCLSIAESAKISTRDIILLNGLDTDCFIVAGNKIKLPPASPTPGPTPTQDNRVPIATSTRPPQLNYEVKDGDVCGIISDRFGISVASIMAQNKLDQNCTIRVGQVLVLNFAQDSATSAAFGTAPPIVAATSTPRSGYSAPLVISPLDHSIYSSTQDALTLQWLTVGLLKDNEWYVVQIQPEGTALVPIFETKATSLKLTSAILGGQVDRKFTWWVQVKRLVSASPDGNNRIYEPLSPPSTPRLFQWTLS